jgi:ribosomal-protein-alanine N-acetyltransferase
MVSKGESHMDAITIRAMTTQAEAEGCAHMMAQSEPWLTLGRSYPACLETILHPDKEVFIAVAEDKVIGSIILNMHGALVGYIQSICVAKEYRGNGVGSSLLDYAETRIFASSANVFLMVSSFNPGARRLYEKRGYGAVGELKDFIVTGHSEILLRKTRKSAGDREPV